MTRQTEWLSRRQTAKLLRYSLRGLDGLVRRGAVKAYRFGNRLLFDRAEVQQAIRAGAVSPRPRK